MRGREGGRDTNRQRDRILTRACPNVVPGTYCFFGRKRALAFGGFARAVWLTVCTVRIVDSVY